MDWDALADDLGPRLYRYFVFRGYGADSGDLVQTVLLRLVEKVRDGSYDAGRGNVRQFAYGIAGHVAHEARRSQGGGNDGHERCGRVLGRERRSAVGLATSQGFAARRDPLATRWPRYHAHALLARGRRLLAGLLRRRGLGSTWVGKIFRPPPSHGSALARPPHGRSRLDPRGKPAEGMAALMTPCALSALARAFKALCTGTTRRTTRQRPRRRGSGFRPSRCLRSSPANPGHTHRGSPYAGCRRTPADRSCPC